MDIINVNPTRMQMTKLKKQLVTAKRGHKMLKDKRDELMRQFIELVQENKRLREKVETELEQCSSHFVNAGAVMSKKALDSSLMSSKQQTGVEVSSRNIMSVDVPVFSSVNQSPNEGDIYPYGFAFTSFELDDAVSALNMLLPDLIRLAEIEKSCELMAAEEEVGFDRQILFFLFLVLIRHHGVTVHQRLAHVVLFRFLHPFLRGSRQSGGIVTA